MAKPQLAALAMSSMTSRGVYSGRARRPRAATARLDFSAHTHTHGRRSRDNMAYEMLRTQSSITSSLLETNRQLLS